MQELKKIKSHLLVGVIVGFVIWAIGVNLITQFFICLFSSSNCFNFYNLANWDGQHFLLIAEKGYLFPYQLAFFPLFPTLIKFTNLLIPLPAFIIGVFLNISFALVAYVYLYKLLKLDYKTNEVIWILILTICFPLSFFYMTVYSEALFFCLSITSLYFYKQKKYWISIVLLALLTLTRMAGIALVVAILIESYLQKDNFYKFLLPFLGIGAFSLFGFFTTGNFLSIIHAETYWERIVTWPGFAIFNSLLVIFREGISYKNFAISLDLVLVLFSVIVLIRSFKNLPRIYFNYALFSLLIPLSTSTFLSWPRFMMVIFPLFIAFYFRSTTIIRVSYCLVGIILTIFFFSIFLNGGWIS